MTRGAKASMSCCSLAVGIRPTSPGIGLVVAQPSSNKLIVSIHAMLSAAHKKKERPVNSRPGRIIAGSSIEEMMRLLLIPAT